MIALYLLETMLLILLAVVGGLVLWLHFRFQALMRSNKQAPILVDALSNSIHQAQRGVESLGKTVREDGSKLESDLKKAQDSMQDLDYMMGRAEKIISRLDTLMDKAQTVSMNTSAVVPTANNVDLSSVGAELNKMQETAKPALTKEQEERSVLMQASRALEEGMRETMSAVRREQQAKMAASEPAEDPIVLSTKSEPSLDDIPAFLTQKEGHLVVEVTPEAGPTEKDVLLNTKPTPRIVSQRIATPTGGAQAYGRTMDQLSASTEAEDELRQALEGRL